MTLSSFWEKAIEESGADLLISKADVLVGRRKAIEFAKWASTKKRILGFEGFYYNGETYRALSECIADFSGHASDDNGYQHTVNALRSPDFNKANFIEFVFEDLEN